MVGNTYQINSARSASFIVRPKRRRLSAGHPIDACILGRITHAAPALKCQLGDTRICNNLFTYMDAADIEEQKWSIG